MHSIPLWFLHACVPPFDRCKQWQEASRFECHCGRLGQCVRVVWAFIHNSQSLADVFKRWRLDWFPEHLDARENPSASFALLMNFHVTRCSFNQALASCMPSPLHMQPPIPRSRSLQARLQGSRNVLQLQARRAFVQSNSSKAALNMSMAARSC